MMKLPQPPPLKFEQKKIVDQAYCVKTASVFRRQSLVTASELSDKSGIDKSLISLLESGKRKWTEENFSKYINGVKDIVSERSGNTKK